LLRQFDKPWIDATFNGALTKQSRAERVDSADKGKLKVFGRLSCLSQLFAESQFHLACGRMRERHRHNSP
jgi:hypothetical protein